MIDFTSFLKSFSAKGSSNVQISAYKISCSSGSVIEVLLSITK